MRALVVTIALAICGAGMPATAGPASAAVDEGMALLHAWQLEDALQLTERMLVEYPEDPELWALAGHVQHHRGEHISALSLLDAAHAAGVNTGQDHPLVASTAAYAAHFQRLESEHFSIRYVNKDEIVAHYAWPVLEAAYRNIGGALGLLPAERGEKIVVEIFPDARGLAGATGLTVQDIATSGTIAVCKFHRLMITSPLATMDGYHWADTIAHELTHLIISKRSHNSIPIWLHEGIAKYYESLWKGPAGEALGAHSENLLAKAVKENRLITFQQMHPSMAKLPSQDDAALAFAEVFTTIEFMRERFGNKSVPKVLALAGEGVSLEQALKRVFALDLNGIEQAWKRWVRKRKFRIVPGAEPVRIRLSDNDAAGGEQPLEKITDKKVHDFSRLGEMLQLRGHEKAAVVEYEKAYGRAGLRYPTLLYRLARAYLQAERATDARVLLDKALAVHPQFADLRLLAGRVQFKAGNIEQAQQHFEAVRLQNPFNPQIHAALTKLYEKQGKTAQAEQEKKFLQLAAKARPTRSYELPPPPPGESRLTVVAKPWGMVRIDGGLPFAAPLIDYPVSAGEHTIELIGRDGSQRTKQVQVKSGEGALVVVR